MTRASVLRIATRVSYYLRRGDLAGRGSFAVAWALAWLSSTEGMSAASSFPTPFNTEHDTTTTRLSAAETAATLKLPPGFKATVFAAEPDAQNPIAMAWDARGRLWVAENYTYAELPVMFDLNLRDRILV